MHLGRGRLDGADPPPTNRATAGATTPGAPSIEEPDLTATDPLLAELQTPRRRAGGPDPTDEQQAIVDAFGTGRPLVIEAGAGTGKTTTLELVAHSTGRPGRYLAFNKAIVVDAERRFPRHVTVSTAHSLAYRAVVGPEQRARLNGPRLRSSEVASILGLEHVAVDSYTGRRKHLEPWRLAGIVLRAIEVFCQSADLEPGPHHVPRQDGLTATGQAELAEHLYPAIVDAWADLQHPAGHLQYRHGHYLKAFQLRRPRLECEFILFDEAQDASPVMAAIVEDQDHAQAVWVGDSAQQIYAWAGAVNAMAGRDGHRLLLTRSWRFGPAIAEAANRVLQAIGTDLRLQGSPHVHSALGHLAERDVTAVLTRTNAQAVVEVLDALDDGRRPHLVGNGEEVLRFAYGASDLQQGKRSTHPDLACFDNWAEVLDYVETDAMGSELTLLTKLVQRFTTKMLIAVLQHELAHEHDADVVISTAHKAKGREWDRVRLAGDLNVEEDPDTGEVDIDELRLLYVAVTRARQVLDAGAVALCWNQPPPDDDEEVEPW